jgi:hypothetical protein
MGALDGSTTVVPAYLAFAAAQLGVGQVTIGRAQGYTGTSATSGKVIRATAYAPQGTNAQRSLKSTNALDNISGSGAQQVTINYLNTSFQSKSDTVWLSGTLATKTNATDIAFIESMVVAQVGADGGNDGTINIFTDNAGAGSIWGSIAASDNMTFWAHHYVPAGVTCYLISMTVGATIVAGQTNLNHSGNPLSSSVPQLQLGMTLCHLAGASTDHDFEVPLALAGPDLVWLVERPNTATVSTAVAGFEYVQF